MIKRERGKIPREGKSLACGEERKVKALLVVLLAPAIIF